MRDSKAKVRARHSSEDRDSIEVMKLETAASSIMFPCSSCVLIVDEDALRATERDLDRARAFPGDGDLAARPVYIVAKIVIV